MSSCSAVHTRLPPIKIGVVGFSDPRFNQQEAAKLLVMAFDQIVQEHPKDTRFEVVSGWSYLGIPGLAYEEATRRGWLTRGIACGLIFDFDLYPVDSSLVSGENWGEDSNAFIDEIKANGGVLVRVGGGEQSFKEVKMALACGIPVIQYDLDLLTEN